MLKRLKQQHEADEGCASAGNHLIMHGDLLRDVADSFGAPDNLLELAVVHLR